VVKVVALDAAAKGIGQVGVAKALSAERRRVFERQACIEGLGGGRRRPPQANPYRQQAETIFPPAPFGPVLLLRVNRSTLFLILLPQDFRRPEILADLASHHKEPVAEAV